MTQKLKFKYNPESEEEALNLVNRLGAEKIQERLGLFSKLLVISILLFLFLTLLPTFFPGKI